MIRRVIALAFPLVLAFAAGPIGAESICFDYSQAGLSALSRVPYPNYDGIGGVAAKRGYAYVALRSSDLAILDVNDPAAPVEVARFTPPGVVTDVAVDDLDYAYVIAETFGIHLHVLDVLRPADFQIVSETHLKGVPRRLTFGANQERLYLAVGGEGVYVIDIRIPVRPRFLFRFDTPGEAFEAVDAGPYTLIADGETGLVIADFREPLSPRIVAMIDTPGHANGVRVAGSLAYVTDDGYALQVIDIAEPTLPRIIGHVDTPGLVNRIELSGNTVLLGASHHALETIDVTDPVHPRFIGAFAPRRNNFGLAVSGDLAFVTSGPWHPFPGQLDVIAIGNGVTPLQIGQADINGYSGLAGHETRMTMRGARACLVHPARRGLDVLDLWNFGFPHIQSRTVLPSAAFDVALDGEGYLYLPSGTPGMRVVDLSHPGSPVIIATADTPGYAQGIAVVGQRAYVADEASGLSIFDIATPSAPRRLGGLDTRGWGYDVALAGPRAYLADGDYGLKVIDVSSPTSPRLLGEVIPSGSGRMTRVAVTSDGAQAFTSDGRLYVIDTSVATHPIHVRTMEPMTQISDLALIDHSLFVTDMTEGTFIFDVSVPGNPTVIWQDPARLAAKATTAEFPLGLVITNDLLLRIIPAPCRSDLAPEWMGAAQSGPPAPGLLILNPGFPNPAPPGAMVQIDFSLGAPGPVTLRLLDATGHLVRQLFDGSMPAGAHGIQWDGKRESGHPAAAGIYFYELTAGPSKATGRVTILR